MAFSNCKSADCITIKIHLAYAFCMLNTDILINTALVNSKQQLMRIYCILK